MLFPVRLATAILLGLLCFRSEGIFAQQRYHRRHLSNGLQNQSPTEEKQPPAQAQARASSQSVPLLAQSFNRRSAQLDEESNQPPAPYLFTYDIADDENNQQFRKESSDGNVVRGSYGYTDANGLYRLVEYIADPKLGFRVKVKSNEPGMNNMEVGPSGQLESRSSNAQRSDATRFENINLDQPPTAGSADGSVNDDYNWPANVFLDLNQPPKEIFNAQPATAQQTQARSESNQRRLHSQPSANRVSVANVNQASRRPESNTENLLADDYASFRQPSNAVPNSNFAQQTHAFRAAASDQRSKNQQHNGRRLEQQQAAAAAARELDEQPADVNPVSQTDGVLKISEQSRRLIKQLLHPAAAPAASAAVDPMSSVSESDLDASSLDDQPASNSTTASVQSMLNTSGSSMTRMRLHRNQPAVLHRASRRRPLILSTQSVPGHELIASFNSQIQHQTQHQSVAGRKSRPQRHRQLTPRVQHFQEEDRIAPDE